MKRIVLILLLIISVSARTSAQDKDDAYLDSLATVYYASDDYSQDKILSCNLLAAGHYNVDSTLAWAERLLKLSKIQDRAFFEAKALGYKSWALYYANKYTEANDCNFRAILIADSIGNEDIKAQNYQMLGDNYSKLCDYKQSYSYYNTALQIYEQLGDSEMIADCIKTMAQNCISQKMYKQAEFLFQKAIAIDSANNNIDNLLSDINGLISLYLTQYNHTSSEKQLDLIAKAKRELNKIDTMKSDYLYIRSEILSSRIEVLSREATEYGYNGKRLQSVLDTIRQSIAEGYEITEKTQSDEQMTFDIHKANYYTLSKQYTAAKALLDTLTADIDSIYVGDNNIKGIYLACDNYYTAIHDYKNAYHYKSKYYEQVNSQTSIDYAIKAAQDLAQANFDKEMQQHKYLEKRKARIRQFATGALILIVLIAIFEVIRTRRHYRQLNEKSEKLLIQKQEISSQQEEILSQRDQLAQQNEEIRTRNKQINDSIGYASLIQRAVMPDDAMLQHLFSDYYVIYRPLNIVAGDFYWAGSVGKYKMAVCADSTGHGVPGAFVSMLGISLLNDLAPSVIENKGSASLILNEMRRRLMAALGQSKEKYDRGEKMNMDGIDLALVVIDTESDTMHYAGAYRPLWIFDGEKIVEIKPDKMPIGVYIGKPQDFTEHTIKISKGDSLYMFSDGITDQFGYTDSTRTEYRHFSSKRLFKLVGDIAPLPFSEQSAAINNTIDTWQNGYIQLDDITFLAIKL